MINFVAGVEYKGEIYFSAWEYNSFCKADIETGEVEFISFFEAEEMIPRLHNTAFLCNDEVWFVPCTARKIVCVNLVTFEMSYYDVHFNYSKEYSTNGSYQAYDQALRSNDMLYMIPYSIDAMAVVDMNTKNVRYIDGVRNIKSDLTIMEMVGVIYDKKIFLLTYNSESVKVLDIVKGNLTEETWPFMKAQKGVPFVEDGKIYFTPLGADRITAYDPITKKVEYYSLPEKGASFSNAMKIGSDWLITPFTSEYFLVMDKDNHIEKYIPEEKGIFSKDHASMFVIDSEKMKMMVISDRSSIVIWGEKYDQKKVIKLVDGNYKEEMYRNAADHTAYREKLLYCNGVIKENEMSLASYLGLVEKA